MFRKLIFFINLLVVSLLLLAIFVYYTGTEYAPALGVLSLTVPVLIFINLIFVVFWVFKKKRQFLTSLVILVLAYAVFGTFFKFTGTNNSTDDDLKILTFNTRGFNNNGIINEPDVDVKIISFVNDLDPDIICFQEFYHIKQYNGNFSKYPYRFIDFDESKPKGKIIQAIFSKYPILKNTVFDFPKSGNNAIAATILIEKDTLAIYNVHFESFGIVPDAEALSKVNSERLFNKVAKVLVKQQEQSSTIQDDIEKNPHNTILCGDFNNTQFSNTYKITSASFQDTFLEAGSGFGRTLGLFGLPMRIDYIMADDHFEVTSHTNYDVKYSDHYPVMATLKLKSKE